MRRLYWLFPLAIAACAVFALAARAGDREDCNSSNDEVKILGCSAVIEAGEDSVKDTAKAHYNRGNAYKRKGERALAIADYSKAISLNPKFAEAYHMRGNVYSDRGDYARAIPDYEKTIALRPKKAAASYYNRGNVYFNQGKYEFAIADYGKAIALMPKDADAYCNRGVAYEELGNNQKAAADYRKALALRPGHELAAKGLNRVGE